MTQEEITKAKEEIVKAASITYGNAMRRALWGKTLACYMFTEGMKYQKTGKTPVDDLDKLMEGIGDALELKKALDEEKTDTKPSAKKEIVDITDWK